MRLIYVGLSSDTKWQRWKTALTELGLESRDPTVDVYGMWKRIIPLTLFINVPNVWLCDFDGTKTGV